MDLAKYPTAEQAEVALTKTNEWLALPREKRIMALRAIKDEWAKAHAAAAEASGASQEDLTGHIANILDKVVETVGGTTASGQPTLADKAIESVVPRDNKQAMIDAALFAVGPEAMAGKASMNALTRLGMRLAIPTVGGAIGGATIGDTLGGAGRGLTEGVGGEGIAGALRMGRRTIGAADFARLQGWLEPRLGVKIPDVQTFRRLFRGGEILSKAEDQFARASNQAKRMLGKSFQVEAPLTVGTSTGQKPMQFAMPLEQAEQHLRTLEEAGWDYQGNPIKGHTGRAIRDQVHQIEGDIAEQLDKTNKKAASLWYTARGKLRTARTLKNLFSEKDIVNDKDMISFDALQQYVSDSGPNGYKLDLQQSMGDAEQTSLSRTVHRGAPEGREDRPGKGIFSKGFGMSTHGSLYGHPSLPYPARHVGEVPFDLGRGRALSALITIGPYQLANKIDQMTDTPTVPGYVEGSSKTMSGEPLPAPTAAASR